MGAIYSLCSYWLLGGAAYFACWFCVYLLLARKSSVRNSVVDYMQEKPVLSTTLFVLCLLICVFSNRSFYRWVGCDDIRTMPAGEYCYYVEVNREYGSTYTLPAKIEVSQDGYTVTDADGNEHTRTYSAYRLITVYFNNGGYLRVDGEEFELDEPFSFFDQNDEYWECTFTNRRCSDAPFDETNDVSDWDIIRLTFCVIVLLLTYFNLHNSVCDAIDKEKALNPSFQIGFCSKDPFYHSTENCPNIKNKHGDKLRWIYYTEDTHPSQKRRPCNKCCFIVNGEVRSYANRFDPDDD